MKRKKLNQTVNLAVDFHTHILPGIDDGSPDRARSEKMLESAKEYNIETVVLTSHFYPHETRVSEFLLNRKHAYDKIKSIPDAPKMIFGAEVLLCEGIERMEKLEELCIENTRTMLVELPSTEVTLSKTMIATIKSMIEEMGITVVLAHANRYSPDTVDKMVELGAVLQINLEHMCSFGDRRRVKKWLAEGVVYAIGSDMHRSGRRYEDLKKATKYFGEYFEEINSKMKKLLNI